MAYPSGIYLYLMGLYYPCAELTAEECDIHGISLDQLIGLLERREKYWGSGEPGGLLKYVELERNVFVQKSPELLITYHKDFGFMFQWIALRRQPADVPDYWLAMSKERIGVTVPVQIDDQSSYWFPSHAFLPIDIAQAIVKSFVDSKGKSKSKAVRLLRLNEDFSEPDSWRQF